MIQIRKKEERNAYGNRFLATAPIMNKAASVTSQELPVSDKQQCLNTEVEPTIKATSLTKSTMRLLKSANSSVSSNMPS